MPFKKNGRPPIKLGDRFIFPLSYACPTNHQLVRGLNAMPKPCEIQEYNADAIAVCVIAVATVAAPVTTQGDTPALILVKPPGSLIMLLIVLNSKSDSMFSVLLSTLDTRGQSLLSINICLLQHSTPE